MISSAVVIPEDRSPALSNSPSTLKRRQSSLSPDSNKRPRIEAQSSLDYGDDPQQSTPNRPTPKSAIEERKRGKRLFGALLGTLSQSSSKPAHRKRDEIEQRQRERLKKDNEEREQVAQRKREALDRTRKIEQKEWNAKSKTIQHANMRATANFLKTQTEPQLYYKPWDLRPEEEEQIRRQIADVEVTIQRESSSSNAEKDISDNSRVSPSANGHAAPEPSEPNGKEHHPDEKAGPATEQSQTEPADGPQQIADEKATEVKADQSKEYDQGGGELVEGREDDVMY